MSEYRDSFRVVIRINTTQPVTREEAERVIEEMEYDCDHELIVDTEVVDDNLSEVFE